MAGKATITVFDPAQHRDQVEALWKLVFAYTDARNATSLIIDRKCAAGDGLFFVATAGDVVVGTVMAGYDGHRGWIYSMAVHPEYRHGDIGSSLLSHAEDTLTALGCVKINLQVMPGNDAAQEFYEANGFSVENRISMGKEITVNVGGNPAPHQGAGNAERLGRGTVPLLEFDPAPEAIIEPSKVIKHRDMPEHCVLCFAREVIERAKDRLDLQPLRPLKSEMGEIPVFAGTYEGERIGVVAAAVGASLAAAALDEVIARGGRWFVACGSCGVLDNAIGSGDIVVPTSALRDEGASYHYLPAGRNALPSAPAVDAITRVLDRHKCHYIKGRTWTTDGFYRETRKRVARRREQGCLTVEMEAAALFAVAEFRDVRMGMLLYGGDDVSGIEWDRREFGRKIPARETLFWLAVEACVQMGSQMNDT